MEKLLPEHLGHIRGVIAVQDQDPRLLEIVLRTHPPCVWKTRIRGFDQVQNIIAYPHRLGGGNRRNRRITLLEHAHTIQDIADLTQTARAQGVDVHMSRDAHGGGGCLHHNVELARTDIEPLLHRQIRIQCLAGKPGQAGGLIQQFSQGIRGSHRG